MAVIDIIEQRLEDATEDVEAIKAKIKDVAESKNIEVVAETDTPMSVLNKIEQQSDKDVVKGLADGSLTEFVASDFGVTSLAPYRFQNFTSLTKLDLTGVTDIPVNTAYQDTALVDLTIDESTTNIGTYAFSELKNANLDIDLNLPNGTTIGSRAFQSSNVRSIKGNLGNIGELAFDKIDTATKYLQKVNIKVNGTIGNYAFQNRYYINDFTLDPESVVTTLGSYAFGNFGRNRTTPENNIFTFDFRNSTFTSVNSYCFYGASGANYNKYFDIYFPSTLTTVQSYVFQYTDHFNIYYNSVPTLSNTNTFSNATNFRNFFPYALLRTAKNATNWSSSTYGIVDSIYGYAEENTFEVGDTLPDTDADGYALTWYSDRDMTIRATIVSDPTQIYYCQVGARVKVHLSTASYQATLTVSDGVNTYTDGDLVPIYTTLTLTAVGEGANTQPYMFTLNGTTIASGDTYTVYLSDIDIICIYYDGVNPPVDPVFANNSPQQVKTAIDTGLHRTLWTIGDSKPVTLTNGLAGNIYYIDQQANRYEKVDGTGYSNAIFEFRPLVMTAMMNNSSTNAGGWAASRMNTVTMADVYNLLPSDWQAVISEVKVPSATSYSDSTIVYANNRTFIPSGQEIFGSSYVGSYYYNEGCTQFDWYVGKSNADRIRQYNGTNLEWWLRSPSRSNSTHFCIVQSSGSIYANYANISYGVCACLAI